MARRVLTIQIADEGRDKGKVFVITEMPATQAEKWAIRAFMALARNGTQLPDGVEFTGWAGIAQIGLSLFQNITFADAEGLLDEMMSCVQAQPSPTNPAIVRPLVEDDIEEIATRIKLRVATFKLHANFSQAAS